MAEFYLSNKSGKRFQGGTKDPVGQFFAITHDCPFCGNKASVGRPLLGIASRCIEREKAIFSCQSCNKYLTVPSEIFVEDCLETIKQDPTNIYLLITERTQSELLIHNWGQVLFDANKGGPVNLASLEWNGEGNCPLCGLAQEVSIGLKCLRCQAMFWVNQNDISHTGNTNVRCSNCGHIMVIPPTVWCPVCNRNLRSEEITNKLFKEANK